ncbi:hypothetical protein AB0K16_22140 [Nonomuraea jabiensis]|uniref:hypothetical protein n=1 Tax=Nonomuraea jabiensis TaxID=882448 RepID=UPI003422BAD2
MDIMTRARELGTDHGKEAAAWYFDGNTPEYTYRRVLKGIEDGDPEVLDTFPTHGLSGEMADGFSARDLEIALGINPDDESEDFGDVCDAYEEAFNTAVETEIARVARIHVDS